MKNVMVVTTGRADYGLLYPLIKEIESSPLLKLSVAVTGSHLSKFHGFTINLIKQDEIKVDYEVDIKIDSDTEHDVCESISIGVSGFSEVFSKHKPDAMVVLGDRYELFCAAIPAVVHKIPICHIHGGELTKGMMDDSVRHSITKMSSLHFTSLEVYRNRVIQMGESPGKVFNVGAIGLDTIRNIDYPDLEELNRLTGVDFDNKIALMTYHPVTLDDYESTDCQIRAVLGALAEFDICALTTMPNIDTGNNVIFNALNEFAQRYPDKLILVKNLGQRAYLGSMKYASLMIGNSSSGIIESPFFKIPVVNIGDRQGGRYRTDNIIDVECEKQSIKKGIQMALSSNFKEGIKNMENPYGDGKSAEKILMCLEQTDFSDRKLLKKVFFDL